MTDMRPSSSLKNTHASMPPLSLKRRELDIFDDPHITSKLLMWVRLG